MSEPKDGASKGAPEKSALVKPVDETSDDDDASVRPIPIEARPVGGEDITHVQEEITHVQEEYRVSVGVLTDPQSLKEYEQAIPGAGKDILQQFFQQTSLEQKHRQEMEREIVAAERAHDVALMRQGDRGQWMAFWIALCGFGLVAYLAWLHQPILAGVIAALDIGSLVAAFLYGRKKQADERIAEAQQPRTVEAPQLGTTHPSKQLPTTKDSKDTAPKDSKTPQKAPGAPAGNNAGKKPPRRKK